MCWKRDGSVVCPQFDELVSMLGLSNRVNKSAILHEAVVAIKVREVEAIKSRELFRMLIQSARSRR